MDSAEESYPPTERQPHADGQASHGELSTLQEQILQQPLTVVPQEAFVKLLGWVRDGPHAASHSALVCLGLLFRRGHSSEFLECPDGTATLFKYFNVMSRELRSLEPH